MYSKAIQLYIYMYLFFFKCFSHLGYYRIFNCCCSYHYCWCYLPEWKEVVGEVVVCCAGSSGWGAGPPGFQSQLCHPGWCDPGPSVHTGTEFFQDTSLTSRPAVLWCSHAPHVFSPCRQCSSSDWCSPHLHSSSCCRLTCSTLLENLGLGM